jgi:hypothetical protein
VKYDQGVFTENVKGAIVSALIIALVCVFLLAWSFNYPARKRGMASEARARQRVAGRYQAVSVVSRTRACPAANEIDGRRFLADDAPLLPVPGCDSAKCNCRYARHGDRRRRGDRRSFTGLQTELYTADGKPERRSIRGRRKEDFEQQGSDFGLGEIEWVR